MSTPATSPEPSPVRLREAVEHLLAHGWDPAIEHVAPERRASVSYWTMWSLPLFGERSVGAVEAAVRCCREAYPDHVVRLLGLDRGRQRIAVCVELPPDTSSPVSAPLPGRVGRSSAPHR